MKEAISRKKDDNMTMCRNSTKENKNKNRAIKAVLGK